MENGGEVELGGDGRGDIRVKRIKVVSKFTEKPCSVWRRVHFNADLLLKRHVF